MREHLGKIEKIIDKEIDVYSTLEQYIEEKTAIIAKNDVAALEELDTKIIEKTTSVAMLARSRQQECIHVGRIDLTFSELIGRALEVDDELAARLDEKKQKLDGIVKSIQHKNNINAKLLDNTLFLMGKTIDFIFKLVVPELGSYTQNGQMKKLNDNYKLSSIDQEV